MSTLYTYLGASRVVRADTPEIARVEREALALRRGACHNVLYWEGAATIIDVPQAVDPRINSSARELLGRDVANVYRYFSRHGVRADPARLADNLWRRFMRGEL